MLDLYRNKITLSTAIIVWFLNVASHRWVLKNMYVCSRGGKKKKEKNSSQNKTFVHPPFVSRSDIYRLTPPVNHMPIFQKPPPSARTKQFFKSASSEEKKIEIKRLSLVIIQAWKQTLERGKKKTTQGNAESHTTASTPLVFYQIKSLEKKKKKKKAPVNDARKASSPGTKDHEYRANYATSSPTENQTDPAAVWYTDTATLFGWLTKRTPLPRSVTSMQRSGSKNSRQNRSKRNPRSHHFPRTIWWHKEPSIR